MAIAWLTICLAPSRFKDVAQPSPDLLPALAYGRVRQANTLGDLRLVAAHQPERQDLAVDSRLQGSERRVYLDERRIGVVPLRLAKAQEHLVGYRTVLALAGFQRLEHARL